MQHPDVQDLEKMAIFEGLDVAALTEASQKLYRRQFSAGDLLFAEGAVGEVIYLIHSGKVRLGSAVGLRRDPLAILGSGEHLGETALLDDRPNPAWARAETDVTTWVLYRPDFQDLVARYPNLNANLSRSLNQRLAETDRAVEPANSGSELSLIEYIRESWYARSHAGYLASLRILVGALFISTAIENLQKGLYGEGFRSFVQSWATGNPIEPYRRFLETIVITNWQAFSTVQLIVEPIVMGLFLMIGLFTRTSALVAAFFIANLFLASLGREWPWTYLVILGVLIALIFSRAGRYLGVDQFLAERYPDPPLPLW